MNCRNHSRRWLWVPAQGRDDESGRNRLGRIHLVAQHVLLDPSGRCLRDRPEPRGVSRSSRTWGGMRWTQAVLLTRERPVVCRQLSLRRGLLRIASQPLTTLNSAKSGIEVKLDGTAKVLWPKGWRGRAPSRGKKTCGDCYAVRD